MREHLEQVALARELGSSSVWTSQHLLADRFMHVHSVPLLARVVAEAEAMTFRTAILLLTLTSEATLALLEPLGDRDCASRLVAKSAG